MTKILGTANRQIAVDDTVYDIDLIPPNTPIDTDDIDKQIDSILLSIEGAVVPTDRPGYNTVTYNTIKAKQAIKALISDQVAKARIQELELLRKRWNVEYLRDAIDDRIAQLRSTQ